MRHAVSWSLTQPPPLPCAVGTTSCCLLPLTHSDGVSLDAPDTPASGADGGWDFRAVFAQLRSSQASPSGGWQVRVMRVRNCARHCV